MNQHEIDELIKRVSSAITELEDVRDALHRGTLGYPIEVRVRPPAIAGRTLTPRGRDESKSITEQ